jgi:hypothetical protein
MAYLTAQDICAPHDPHVDLPDLISDVDLPGLVSDSSEDSDTDDESDELPVLIDEQGHIHQSLSLLSFNVVDEQTTSEVEADKKQEDVTPIAQLRYNFSSSSSSICDPEGWDTLTITRTTPFTSMTRSAILDSFHSTQGAIQREFYSAWLPTDDVRVSPAFRALSLTNSLLLAAEEHLEKVPVEPVEQMEDSIMRIGEVMIFGAARKARGSCQKR